MRNVWIALDLNVQSAYASLACIRYCVYAVDYIYIMWIGSPCEDMMNALIPISLRTFTVISEIDV